jgi:ABC-type lipoprotein export system ATPase subunit
MQRERLMLLVEHLHKRYRIGGVRTGVLCGVDFTLDGGRICSISGASGCGKTTLLNVIAGITAPDAGTVHINGSRMVYALDALSSRRRNRDIGFIFQTFRLLYDETVMANVLLPARIRGRVGRDTRERARALLERLGLERFAAMKTAVLSGGQKQRVAIARALINSPGLILAGEPTANLDKQTAREIFSILLDLKKEGKAILVVTHDEYMHRKSDAVYVMENGRLAGGA